MKIAKIILNGSKFAIIANDQDISLRNVTHTKEAEENINKPIEKEIGGDMSLIGLNVSDIIKKSITFTKKLNVNVLIN